MDTDLSKRNELNETFLKGTDSKLHVKLDYEKKDVDYSWLDIFEETTYYIDNILRNPKKFIINEEEVVKVEKSKKVTVESIIHLTQHTNFIQKFDPEKNEVKPSKVLNINKEESLDTYENRFIYTVIKHMDEFIERHVGATIEESYCRDEKGVEYNGDTNIGTEKVHISLNISSVNNTSTKEALKNGMTLDERIRKVKVQIAGFKGTELFSALQRAHVSIVRPPIRRTNVILKNPNFQKAMDLYNYLMNYDSSNFSFVKDNQDYIDTGYVKREFDESFLKDYLTMTALSDVNNKETNKSYISLTVNKIVSTILDENEDITEEEFMSDIKQEYTKAINSIKERDEYICNTLNEHLNNFNNSVYDLIKTIG